MPNKLNNVTYLKSTREHLRKNLTDAELVVRS